MEAYDKLKQLIQDLIKRRRGDIMIFEKETINEFKTAEALPKLIDKTGFKAIYDDKTVDK